MLKPFRARLASALVALACAASYTNSAHAQAASQVPPGMSCFQAMTGQSGMVGVTSLLVGGSSGSSGVYSGVALTGGSGSGATANITVSGGAVTAVNVVNPGLNYQAGDQLSAASSNIGGVSGFSVTVASVSINSSLAGGSVGMYVPGTTTMAATWQDAGQQTLNSNPISLDSNGCALIYGAGTYRQVLYDSLGNVVWDRPTTVNSAISWGGTSGGSPNAQTVTAAGFGALDGQTIQFRAGFTNTGSTTLAVNGGSATAVYKDTSSGLQSLSGGEIFSGEITSATYDATLGAFHIPPGQAKASNAFATLASSSTTDLGSASSNQITVTGTTTISFFGSSASTTNPLYNVRFTSALTINAGANIATPSGQNIRTSPGSWILAQYQGSGAWAILSDGSGGVPAGAVMPFNLSSCPTGWSAADGSASSVDLRGYFVRGLDTGGSVDPGRSLATTQQDQFQNHTHTHASVNGFMDWYGTSTGGTYTYQNGTGASGSFNVDATTGYASNGNTGSETRPKNVALLYCVKN